MANVIMKYNPFYGKTDISIDGFPIEKTSGLYKYLNTPIQNWVNEFFPSLIEHCNDDEIQIKFIGVKTNYDLLERGLEIFLSKNYGFSIQLSFTECMSQYDRVLKLKSIIDELNDLRRILGVEDDDLSIGKMQMVIVVDETENTFTKEIKRIANKNKDINIIVNNIDNINYETIDNLINSMDKPMVIYCINHGNNEKRILDSISCQYNIKGKQNKNRFIFVSDNNQDNSLLRNDYLIKKTKVHGKGDIVEIEKLIEEYYIDYYLTSLLRFKSAEVNIVLKNLREEALNKVNNHKEYQEIAGLENEFQKELEKCELKKHSNKDQLIDNAVQNIRQKLVEDYSCYLHKKVQPSMDGFPAAKFNEAPIIRVTSSYMKKSVNSFMSGYSNRVQKYMKEYTDLLGYNITVDNLSNMESILNKIGCEYEIDSIRKYEYIIDGKNVDSEKILSMYKKHFVVVKKIAIMCEEPFDKIEIVSGKTLNKSISNYEHGFTEIEPVVVGYFKKVFNQIDKLEEKRAIFFNNEIKNMSKSVEQFFENKRKEIDVIHIRDNDLNTIEKIRIEIESLTALEGEQES